MFKIFFLVFGLAFVSSRVTHPRTGHVKSRDFLSSFIKLSRHVSDFYKLLSKRRMCSKLNRKDNRNNDGGWSSWSPFTQHFLGVRARKRECNFPSPSFGGRYCRGTAIQIQPQQIMFGITQKKACPVPFLPPAMTLKEAVANLRVVINFIEKRLAPMGKQIEKLERELRKTESDIASIFSVLMDYRSAAKRLNSTLVSINGKLSLSRLCGKWRWMQKIRLDRNSVKADQKKFRQFIQKIDYELKATEREKAQLIKKKTQTTELGSKLKNLILNYELYDTVSENDDFDLDPEEANEERDEINFHLEEGNAKLRTIFC